MSGGVSLHERLADWIAHLDHVLPSQAPIRDFVHHNTLHGYQHLPFDQALAAARRELGISGYWPADRFRAEHAAGRISLDDLEAVLDAARNDIDVDVAPGVTRRAVWRAGLRFDCATPSPARLRWALDEAESLVRVPADIAAESRRWRHGAREGELPALWQTARSLVETLPALAHDDGIRDWAGLVALLGVGGECRGTLRDLILTLSGEDILEQVRADLLRHCAAHLDHGLAAWHNPRRAQGFYAAWRHLVAGDAGWTLTAQADARKRLASLPDDPVETIGNELARIGLPEPAWEAYLRHLALQLPGWSGMFLWRDRHPGYGGLPAPVSMTDYLAVRLVLENLAADATAHRIWGTPAQLAALEAYFCGSAQTEDHAAHGVELRLRLACHHGELPESLASRVQQMEAPGERPEESRAAWAALASAAAEAEQEHRRALHDADAARAWPLFRLALLLGLDAPGLQALGTAGAAGLLGCLQELDADRMGHLWLQAYERHYADQVFAALVANHRRALPATDVSAQLVVCMDDREEGFRRHLEEADPALETLGGAAHFGVFQNWKGLGDTAVTPLCPVVPVVIRPSHEVHEVPREGQEAAADQAVSRRRRAAAAWARRLQWSRFGLGSSAVATVLTAPAALADLALRAFAPRAWGRRLAAEIAGTRLALNASPAAAAQVASPDQPRLGFTDDEQAERIGNFLTGLGLTAGFAPLVVIMGHGSNSQNNPHLAAYDCGACSGRHSGPNARLFAAMANRPAVRERLAARGIAIPLGTWFLGAEHNTCDDSVSWYDLEDVPPAQADAVVRLQRTVRSAGEAHAVERCRRLMSAPLGMSPRQAWRHVGGRRHDFAQPRPELGHVTNACAVIGRRQVTRGAFFDRRAFLISYDPTRDPEGAVLTRHLTINGPVGAGINLEYYFSTVDNERFGCGTKTMHNVAGGLGVMAGASSDLRTGLPRQMIEIHEPMRLLVIVEQTTEMLTRIYQAQPAVQELVGNGWLLLAAIEPVETAGDEAVIHRFDPARGWVRWHPAVPLPSTVARSADWFGGQRMPLAPVLLTASLPGAVPAAGGTA